MKTASLRAQTVSAVAGNARDVGDTAGEHGRTDRPPAQAVESRGGVAGWAGGWQRDDEEEESGGKSHGASLECARRRANAVVDGRSDVDASVRERATRGQIFLLISSFNRNALSIRESGEAERRAV